MNTQELNSLIDIYKELEHAQFNTQALIGRKIKEYREQMKLSRKEFAEMFQLRQQYVAQIENNTLNTQIDLLKMHIIEKALRSYDTNKLRNG